jgi:hypothetical protein
MSDLASWIVWLFNVFNYLFLVCCVCLCVVSFILTCLIFNCCYDRNGISVCVCACVRACVRARVCEREYYFLVLQLCNRCP